MEKTKKKSHKIGMVLGLNLKTKRKLQPKEDDVKKALITVHKEKLL